MPLSMCDNVTEFNSQNQSNQSVIAYPGRQLKTGEKQQLVTAITIPSEQKTAVKLYYIKHWSKT